MAKKLMVKTGSYTDKEGNVKNEWKQVGVEMSNDKGSYIMLDPSVNLAGLLQLQNMHNHKNGGKVGRNLMVSVFEDRPAQQQPAQSQHQPTTQEVAKDDIPF